MCYDYFIINNMSNNLIPIKEAASMLGVSIDTLRRWEEEGKIKSIRFTERGHRYYNIDLIQVMLSDLFKAAKDWVLSPESFEPKFYCPDTTSFQTRLNRMEAEMQNIPEFNEEFSLVTSMVGEIGNNSFDHNLGAWPDVRGIFFAYDLNKRQVVLADRGQGILTTLKRVRPDLSSNKEALRVAFTEKISGRAPENRGNGLKYVRLVISQLAESIPTRLYFQTGDAAVAIKRGDKDFQMFDSDYAFRGCLVLIEI